MTAVQRFRYDDANTVSDEHGKGAEVLRQEVMSESDRSGGNATTNHHVHYCEVDEVIRFIRYMSVDLFDLNADVTAFRNRGGTLTALHAARALDLLTTEEFVEEVLTVAKNSLRKDDSVYAILVRDVSSTEDGDFGLYFGWIPNVHELDADHRTY